LSSMDETKMGKSHVIHVIHIIHVEEIWKADYVDASYCGVYAGSDTSAEDAEQKVCLISISKMLSKWYSRD
jgi:hypothetical protein